MLKYYPQLDSLRAIAVLGVVFSHYYAGGPWGDFGVRLFFVLSGFLITMIILYHRDRMTKTGASAMIVARNFYVRRTLRLFPIFYLSLSLYLILSLTLHKNIGGILDDWPWHFAYLTNVLVFVKDKWLGPLSPYWSLAVEEQFYLFWFWFVLLLPQARLPAIMIAFIVFAPAFRATMYFLGYDHHADYLLPACVDTLAAGALLAVLTHPSHKEKLILVRRQHWKYYKLLPYVALTAFVLLVALSYGFDKDSFTARVLKNTVSSFLFAAIVYSAYNGISGRTGRLLSNPMLIYIGKISYGIYVYHMLVRYIYREIYRPHLVAWLENHAILHAWQAEIEFLILTAATLTIAHLSWTIIEKPINRLKGRYSEGLGSAG